MNEKLQRLAQRMVDLFPNKKFTTVQDCFEQFKSIYKQQFDYFKNFQPENTIKLIFYIYSLKNTGSFKEGESYLNKISFASLLFNSGNYHEDSCSSCGGEGTYNCDVCDGVGNIPCDNCDGTGDEDCSECGGAGDINDDGESITCPQCNGDGEETCSDCGGDGEVSCGECNGNGTVDCEECDGTGSQETSEMEYIYYVIVTWNKYIKDRCELTAGTLEPAFSEYDFDRLSDEYMVIGYQEDHAELRSQVESNELYCTNYEDEPELHKSYSNTLWIWMDNDNLNRYTL